NLTGQGWRINSQVPSAFVEMSPHLAEKRGVENGGLVRLTSRRGQIEVPVLVTDRPSKDNLYTHVHTSRQSLNLLTGDHHDPDVDTPAFKELAVRMEVLERSGESPLPRVNYR